MNIGMIIYFLGWVLKTEGLLMLLPCLIAVIYQEASGLYFLGTGGFCVIAGWLMSRKKPENTVFYAREGFVSVALSWIVLSFFGCMPFFLSGEIPRLEDAMFEIISGFTTTGASILSDVEALSKCMLMWRSFSHWIGGMGVLVFILAVLPLAGGQNIHIMRAESPGPSVGKLVPRVKLTAKILYVIYFCMTVVQILILLASGMHWFDAVAMSFGSAGTGGFGILNSSCGSYTMFQQAVIAVFMTLFGINFNVYYLFLIKRPKEALRCEEMRAYLGIILVSILLIAWNIRGYFPTLLEALHHSAFQVSSIITTTGYSTTDFDLWPSFSKTILVMLMFIGACAGSTGGGIKVSRLVVAMRTVKKELLSVIHPRSVKVITFEGKPIEHTILRSINTFLVAYAVIFALSVLFVSIDNLDPTTNFTAVAATLNNIGPGLGIVGPVGNFGVYSPFAKIVLMFDMLAGRLELIPMLVLFSPATWRKNS
ncbi:MAG TPA: TrkH family potassium uptake protein [Candidatus Ventrimonas merdavium]|nr:TrkH family potassium uptake protein [Candidatus Ventrimonas merdavium]